MPERSPIVREFLISDAVLERIARTDHGRDADVHMNELRTIRSGVIPDELDWHPREVLQLARWSLPSDSRLGERQEEHLGRLFACSVLLMADSGSGQTDFECSTLAAFVDSLFALKREPLTRAGASLVLFRIRELNVRSQDLPFFALSVLLALVLLRPNLSKQEWGSLAEWVVEEEAVSRRASGFTGGPWMLGSVTDDSRHLLWRGLRKQVLQMPQVTGIELVLLGMSEW